jgi:hypothetical protein
MLVSASWYSLKIQVATDSGNFNSVAEDAKSTGMPVFSVNCLLSHDIASGNP